MNLHYRKQHCLGLCRDNSAYIEASVLFATIMETMQQNAC
jgi:hypothetical protein